MLIGDILYALLYVFTLYYVMNMLFKLSAKVPLISSVCESHLTDYRTSNINLSGQMKEKGLDLVQSSWLYVILMTIRLNITIIY